jgi:hypothetical protein
MPDLTGIGAVADLATTVVNKIWPDKSEAERQQLAAAVALVQGQLDVNKVEAANPSVFVSGWRPGIGWCCCAALVYHYIARPLLPWVLAVCGAEVPALPALDMGDLITILLGMLGLGALRSADKFNGVTK